MSQSVRRKKKYVYIICSKNPKHKQRYALTTMDIGTLMLIRITDRARFSTCSDRVTILQSIATGVSMNGTLHCTDTAIYQCVEAYDIQHPSIPLSINRFGITLRYLARLSNASIDLSEF